MRYGCGLDFFGFFTRVVKMEEDRWRWGGEGRLGMEGLKEGYGWIGLGGGGEGRMSASGERDG